MGTAQCFLQIGEPTILINNAGVVQGKLVIDLSVEDVQQYVVYVYLVTSFSQFVFQNVWCKHFLSFLDFKGLPSCDVKEKIRSYCRLSITIMVTLLINSSLSKVSMSSALGMTGVAQMGKSWNDYSLGPLLILFSLS